MNMMALSTRVVFSLVCQPVTEFLIKTLLYSLNLLSEPDSIPEKESIWAETDLLNRWCGQTGTWMYVSTPKSRRGFITTIAILNAIID